ncbi:MAG: hypothetical protein ACI841_004867 [Planctomycetota bacterium]|jgi:hypothetical protein
MSAQVLETRTLTYSLELTIEATPEQVWNSLTEEINAWWLPDYHMTGPDSIVTFDTRAGGQLREETPSGASLLWYTVHMCVPHSSVDLIGHLSAAYGGPATTMLHLGLEAINAGTRLSITDSMIGHMSDGTMKSLSEGWMQLFRDGLKSYVESN